MYNAKESTVTVGGMSFPYISFGKGKKSLIMIQGLNTRGIQGAALSLAYMYRIFAKEYTNQAVSNTNLTALCLENSLPCMDIVAIEKETEQDNDTIQEEQVGAINDGIS